MTKAELIEAMASDANVSKTSAGKSLDSLITNISKALKKGEKVTLMGFGTFSVAKRKAREGRNPRTGETIKIKAKKVAKFSAGKELRESI